MTSHALAAAIPENPDLIFTHLRPPLMSTATSHYIGEWARGESVSFLPDYAFSSGRVFGSECKHA